MQVTLDFLKSLSNRELAFFYKYLLPQLDSAQQAYLIDFISTRMNENEINRQILRPNIPGMNNCRRCSSKLFEPTLSKEKKCKVCGQLKEKNKLKVLQAVLSDFFVQCLG